ncbi:hypothetical protein OKW39_001913 [Paraburkholderia sp. MM6662-R1]
MPELRRLVKRCEIRKNLNGGLALQWHALQSGVLLAGALKADLATPALCWPSRLRWRTDDLEFQASGRTWPTSARRDHPEPALFGHTLPSGRQIAYWSTTVIRLSPWTAI